MRRVPWISTLPATSSHIMEQLNRVTQANSEVSKRWRLANAGVKFPLWPLPPTKWHTLLEVEKKRDCLPALVYFNTDHWKCKCLWLYLQWPIYSMTTVRSVGRNIVQTHLSGLHISTALFFNWKAPPPVATHLPATLRPPLSHLSRDCNTQVFCWTHKRVSSWMDGLDTHSSSCSKQRDTAKRWWANTDRMLRACFPVSPHVGLIYSPLWHSWDLQNKNSHCAKIEIGALKENKHNFSIDM